MAEKTTETAAATGRLIYEILRLGGRLVQAGDSLVGDLGLTSARWQVLTAAAIHDKPQTVSEIARYLGLSRQSVQRVVNELEQAGFVSLAANPSHKRARLVVVEAKGNSALRMAEARRVPWTENLASSLRGGDIAAAEEMLAKLRRALDAQSVAGDRER